MTKIFTLVLFSAIFLLKPFYSHAQAANVNDSLALVDFYDSTGGPNWTNNTGWLKGPVQNWFGVTVDGNGRISRISFGPFYNQSNGLSGNLPLSIGNLSNLQALELSGNKLTGNIPSTIGNLTKLDTLYIASNQLSGNIPTSLGNLINLQDLDLGGNMLSGSIPASFGNFINLKRLTLDANRLSGGIPATFGNLSGLQYVELGYNQLSDSLPASLGGMKNLQFLYLNNNQLSGNLPASLSNISTLYSLVLSDNKISGSIPASFGALTNLEELELFYNELSGNIPSTLGNLTKLQYLQLYNNQLSGSIPASFGNISNLQFLWLYNNQLSGNIPSSLGSLANLQQLVLYNNQLNGSIPTSLGNLTALVAFEASHNQLSGSIPTSLGNLTNLEDLSLDHNQLTGSVPTSLGSLVALEALFLNNNLISGSIPTSLANAFNSQYSYLQLDSNYFTFNGMEQIAQKLNTYKNVIYDPQYAIPLHFTKNKLSVSAGGTLTNNTYKWYKNNTLIATVGADSTFKPTTAGNYWVAVTNSIATKLTLYSDTILITNAELPIIYLSFTAQPTHNGNLLQWQTATEINSAYFNVQRSTDGVRFTNIAQVNAAGNSSTVQSYQYTDALTGLNPVPPTLFYRLQEADKDGDITYSKIVKLDNNGALQATVGIFPNPVHEVLNVQLAGITGAATILVTDVSGKTLQTQQINTVAGQTININTQALAAGVYFVQVLHDKQSITQKFVKK